MRSWLRVLVTVLFFGASLVTPTLAVAQQVNAFIKQIYIHDCCGRGPYVAVILDRPVPGTPTCGAGNSTFMATSSASPLAKPMLATALTAKTLNQMVTVLGKPSCDSTGVFTEWVGIAMDPF